MNKTHIVFWLNLVTGETHKSGLFTRKGAVEIVSFANDIYPGVKYWTEIFKLEIVK